MKFTKNLTIKTKLLTGFLTVSVLLGSIGIVGGYGIGKMQENAEAIYNTDLKNIDMIHSMKENLLDSRSRTLIVAFSGDVNAIKESVDVLNELETEFDDYLKNYESYDLTESMKQSFVDLGNYSDDYNNAISNTISLAQAGEIQKAMASVSKVEKYRVELSGILDQLISDSQIAADEAYKSSEEYYSQTMGAMYPFITFGLIVKAFLYCPETDGIWCPRTAGENGKFDRLAIVKIDGFWNSVLQDRFPETVLNNHLCEVRIELSMQNHPSSII